MVKSRAEQLAIADTHLTSSFIGFIACAALYLAWAFMVAATRGRDSWLANLSESQVLTLRMGFYGWYAYAAGTAARHVARTFPHDTIEVRQLAGFVVFVAQIVASVLAAGFVVRDLHAMVLFSIGVLLAVVVIRAVPADRRVVAPPAPPSAASRELGAVGWLVACFSFFSARPMCSSFGSGAPEGSGATKSFCRHSLKSR